MRVEPGHAREPVGVTRTLAAAREPSGAPAAVGAGVTPGGLADTDLPPRRTARRGGLADSDGSTST